MMRKITSLLLVAALLPRPLISQDTGNFRGRGDFDSNETQLQVTLVARTRQISVHPPVITTGYTADGRLGWYTSSTVHTHEEHEADPELKIPDTDGRIIMGDTGGFYSRTDTVNLGPSSLDASRVITADWTTFIQTGVDEDGEPEGFDARYNEFQFEEVNELMGSLAFPDGWSLNATKNGNFWDIDTLQVESGQDYFYSDDAAGSGSDQTSERNRYYTGSGWGIGTLSNEWEFTSWSAIPGAAHTSSTSTYTQETGSDLSYSSESDTWSGPFGDLSNPHNLAATATYTGTDLDGRTVTAVLSGELTRSEIYNLAVESFPPFEETRDGGANYVNGSPFSWYDSVLQTGGMASSYYKVGDSPTAYFTYSIGGQVDAAEVEYWFESNDALPADLAWTETFYYDDDPQTEELESLRPPAVQYFHFTAGQSAASDLRRLSPATEGRIGHYEIMVVVPVEPEVELRDIKGDGDADDQVIESMQSIPTQNKGEPQEAFLQRRNAYFQQQVPDESIAYIEPHRAANSSPDMPRLVARLHGGSAGSKVKWRLEVEYLRGNGYRASYVNDFTRPEDKVTCTAEKDADQEWRIFESQDWLNETQQHGFFGGTGKLYVSPVDQEDAPSEPVITFRIGGKNPDPQIARTFIDQSAGAQFWYAYAIARHETYGRVRVNDQIRFYNQFYTEYQGGPIGDASLDMGWAAWAKGWPLYNLDRDRRSDHTRYQNGPGGYGMYQLTWGPKHPNDAQGTGPNAFIPRRMIWNWQDNANGAITELQGKVGAAEALRNGLQAAYPEWPALPDEGHLSGLDAIVVTFYNGTASLPSRKINGANRKTPWTPEMAGQTKTWQFHQNSQNYVQSVNSKINDTMP
jgi:hypothetical protein